jgi:aconitase A
MTFDTDIELQKTFHETVMQHAQNVLRTGPDWAEADEIFKRRDAEQDKLKTNFDAEYDQRVTAERERLQNAPDKLTLDHPAPKGVVLDKDAALTQQAQQNVINSHESDLQSSRDGQQQEMDQLMERVQSRNQQQGVARDAFTRSNDPSAPERRR